MATDVLYNNVKLHNVTTRRWEQEVEYDSSGADVVAQNFKFTFEGVLHAQRSPIIDSEVYVTSGPSNEGNIFRQLEQTQSLLSQPRKDLKVHIGGNLVVDIRGDHDDDYQHTNADVNNGPKPKVISLTPIGDRAFRCGVLD